MSEHILDDRIAKVSQRVDDATRLAIRVTEHEARMCCLALALIARRDFPDARWVALEDSDQGRWQIAEDVLDADLKPLGDADFGWDDEGYASHLYDNVQDTWQAYCREDDNGRHGSGRWLLDIEKVLEEIPDHPVLEILHGRDPDSECGLDVFIAGELIDQDWDEEDIDPGRGYRREDWDARIEDTKAYPHSPKFKAAVLDALEEFGDSEFITD